MRTLIRWTLQPALLLLTMGTGLAAVRLHWNYGRTYGLLVLGLIVGLCLLEAALPLRREWRMTWPSFLRDLKYIAAGSVTIAAVNAFVGLAALALPQGRGPLAGAPLPLSLAVSLLVFEGLNHLYHRASHELGGSLGAFLWKVHAAHHLPDRVYMLMHAAFHPINAFVTRGLTILLPLHLLGASPETVLLFNLLTNLCGLVSHSNLDLRAGWLNYLLVGPELHRFHHSADPKEAKNYAVAVPIFDLIHGTFHYRPGRFPDRLGVDAPETYPHSNEFWKVMRLPFGEASADAVAEKP